MIRGTEQEITDIRKLDFEYHVRTGTGSCRSAAGPEKTMTSARKRPIERPKRNRSKKEPSLRKRNEKETNLEH